VNLPGLRELAARGLPDPVRRVLWTAALRLALVVVPGFGVYRLLAGSPQAAVAPRTWPPGTR
jgi:hypothetical protein